MNLRTFFILSVGTIAISVVSAQTTIPGGYVSGTWTAVGTPYNVQGDITIHADSTLNIQPGVNVIFQGGYTFTVNGYIEAFGTETDSIRFTASTYWMGLKFIDAPDSSHLAYCTISNSGNYFIGLGGINCTNSNPVITHCRISDNHVHFEHPTYAGGIALINSNAEISWCDISNNESGMYGGGINITSSSPVISSCTISGNETLMQGGGISIAGNSSPIITNCTVEQNTSNMYGGGVSVLGGNVTFSECTFGYNIAYDGGGGISISGGNISLYRCISEHNHLVPFSGQGGGIFANSGTLLVDHCTFFADWVWNWDVNGMEIHTGGSVALTVTNSILFSDGYLIVFGSAVPASVSFNDFQNDYFPWYFSGNIPPGLGGLTTTNTNGDSCDVYSNIYMDPLFVDFPGGDYHLTEESPCIDAGDPSSPLDPDNTVTDMGVYYFPTPLMQTLDISAGWTGISSYLIPLNPDIEELLSPIINELLIIYSDDGLYWPQGNLNTLQNWDSEKGYIIKTDTSVELSIEGTYFSNSTISLYLGWNILPVLTNCEIPVEQVNNSLENNLVIICEVAGTKLFWPELGINTLISLVPGKAYSIYILSETTFTFPICE